MEAIWRHESAVRIDAQSRRQTTQGAVMLIAQVCLQVLVQKLGLAA